jgi:hypothetical protein
MTQAGRADSSSASSEWSGSQTAVVSAGAELCRISVLTVLPAICRTGSTQSAAPPLRHTDR